MLTFRYGFNLPHINGMFGVRAFTSPNAITPLLRWEGDRLITTYENSDGLKNLSFFFSPQIEIIPGWLTLSGYVQYRMERMKGTGYTISHNGWSGDARLQLTHWGFVLTGSYQYAQRDLWGEKISWGEDLNMISLDYNWKNWQLGAGVIMPFGKYDQGSKLLSKWNRNEQHMRLNMCMPFISVACNLQWGRQKRSAEKLIDTSASTDLTKGVTVNGETVAWDADTKLPTVGTAGDAVAKFYVVDSKILTAYDGETADASLRADILVDVRGSESQTYRLVKIGLQYWTADNIRATKFTDGTDIAGYGETETAEWKANTTGAYLTGQNADWVKIAGNLYNGYCAVSDKMAPAGWRVPTCADYGNIRTSVGARTASLYKDSAPGSWTTGKEGNNDTGFSVVATGYFSSATGLNSMYSDTYIWTSDSSYDALSKANAIDFFRVTATGSNAVFPTKGLNPHTYNFGHNIRLVRE